MTKMLEIETRVGLQEYTNSGAVAIVARINWHEGRIADWAAYIGAAPDDFSEKELRQTVLSNGNKLARYNATHFFPDLPKERYRE